VARPSSNLRAAAFMRSRFVRLSDAGIAALSPELASALMGPSPPAAAALTEEDRGVLEHVRRYVPRWLGDADRIRPAELVESILVQTAYAYELRGPRRLQAWENLKKMRALVRRIQNRGYATLTRIADHIDALTAGDESNAVLEALDAVNLMTVHASKGLEFPIVFVVNMAKGASGPPRPVRVIVSGDEEPSVSIGPFASEVDETDRERERHETRRLLYVAVTRARDRLYLSSALKDGALAPGRGSLAEVLPSSLAGLFGRAASAFPECPRVAWTSTSGRTFEWLLCRVPEQVPATFAAEVPATLAAEVPATFGAGGGPDVPAIFAGGGGPTRTVTEWVMSVSGTDVPAPIAAAEVSTGVLVHRIIQFSNVLEQLDDSAAQLTWVRNLLRNDELALLENPDAAAASALATWSRLRIQPDVMALLGMPDRYHEVPFSLREPTGILRGTIDCLIRKTDGSLVVLEFKTGKPRPAHQLQLDLYVAAAREMFPGSLVEGRLVYP
jgi:ATP-dependent helicase/nuclease subunit A